MRIDNDSFLKGLTDTNLTKHGNAGLLASKAIKAIALASVLTATGCASPAFQQATDTSNMSYGHIKIPKIDETNYTEIITHSKSGVYAHPMYEGKLATFHFSSDGNAEQAIKSDLQRLGLSESNFDYNNTLLNLIHDSESNGSRHIQDPFSFYEDINYSFINEYTMSVDLESDFGSLKGEELHADLKYFLLMHEAGHSIAEQQMDMVDFLKIPFSADQLIYLENSSDTIAALKTIQTQIKVGRSDEHINMVLDRVIAERKSITGVYDDDSQLKTSELSVLHRTVPSLEIVRKLWQDNKQAIASMSNTDMLRITDIIATTAIEFDFKDDFINEMLGDRDISNSNTSKLELGALSKQFLNHLDRPVSGQNLDFKDELKFNASTLQSIAKSFDSEYATAIADEIAQDTVGYYELNRLSNDDAARFLLNQVVDELKVTDLSQTRYIGHMKELNGFYSSIKGQIKLEGIDIDSGINSSYTPSKDEYGYSY